MKIPAVSDAELSILQTLWDQGRTTVRHIAEQLYPKQTPSDLATVQKLIHRLEQKRLVERDRSAFVHTLVARIERNEFAAQRLAETAEKLARGSLKPLLAHLVESDQLSAEELDEIRSLIQKHRKKNF
jgi:BlaI family penicillinase repressor